MAVGDDDVPANGGGTSHLPHHAPGFMTGVTGDAFALAAGESTDVTRSLSADPSWDYGSMGVACWVQKPGGAYLAGLEQPGGHRALGKPVKVR